MKRRDLLRRDRQPTPAAPIATTPADADPFERSAAIVDTFARGKDPLTTALLARVAFAIRHQRREP